MKTVTDDDVVARLASLPEPEPRVVVAGSFATTTALLGALDTAVEPGTTAQGALSPRASVCLSVGLDCSVPTENADLERGQEAEYQPYVDWNLHELSLGGWSLVNRALLRLYSSESSGEPMTTKGTFEGQSRP